TETGPLAASAVPLPAGVGGGGGGGGARASFFLVTHPLPVPPPQAGEGTLGQEPAPCRNRPLLLLGVFCHAGAVGVDLDVAPGVLHKFPGLLVARFQRLGTRAAHALGTLREARRRQRGNGEPENKGRHDFADPFHDHTPYVPHATQRRVVARDFGSLFLSRLETRLA